MLYLKYQNKNLILTFTNVMPTKSPLRGRFLSVKNAVYLPAVAR
jgi:hypothetical protein